MRSVELRYGGATDVGRVREVNEDSFLARPPVFVVADGMGGHDGGDVASAIVVEEFGRLAEAGYDPARGPETVAATLVVCQQRIEAYAARQQAAGHPSYQAGTTAVVALLVEVDGESRWLLANLGDSRAYRFDGGLLEQVSVDHSLVQELVDAGTITAADASLHPERHIVTRALGASEHPEADYFLLPFAGTARLVLCSDGVNGMLDDEQIGAVLAGAGDPRAAAADLVAAAVAAGGRDNATAVVVDVVGWDHEQPDSERQPVSLEEKLGALP
ncbi:MULTISPECIES: PP2C family protein-serine/threonine phosphatase [Nocardioides]|uniref:Protein phosphatase n=1 Tax=Nocardioides lianchengensis TaxID=1045774 RepID=A0A1G6I764_9ACTN|nr:protein phosphatase 2C domain-containing protein [Nocardioides lianchengensis]NYG13143.1 protein phosphatase [Nocardioides lianchengensis]SDC02377.1 protein phosphatase [Nocardioides lianchengensis]